MIYRHFSSEEWLILQQFECEPKLQVVNDIAHGLFNSNVQASAIITLPLRLRLPLTGILTLPDKPLRAQHAQDTPIFELTDDGVAYEIRLTASWDGEPPQQLWVEAFVGGAYRNRAGKPRAYLYTPDVRRLHPLTHAVVPAFVSKALDGLLMGAMYFCRWYGLTVDRRKRQGHKRFATLHSGGGRNQLVADVRLPDPRGAQRYLTVSQPLLFQPVCSDEELRLILGHIRRGGT